MTEAMKSRNAILDPYQPNQTIALALHNCYRAEEKFFQKLRSFLVSRDQNQG